MKLRTRSVLATVAIVALTAFGKGDVAEYDGTELSSEEGVVVMRVIWDRESKGGMSKAIARGDDKLYAVFKEASGGKRKVTVADIDKLRGFVMPAGRWYLAEIRTPNDRDLPPIAKPLQSFEVLGDHINFSGAWTVKFILDSEGNRSPDVSVDFAPDPVREASDAWPDLFSKKTLVYCPVGRKCKLPSEFKF